MSAKILVIDDEESIRFTFERFLKAAGHLVTNSRKLYRSLDRTGGIEL